MRTTDIVEERGDEGVARVKELTGGLGAHSVVEAVGTQESLLQAIRFTRAGTSVYVGVFHDVALPVEELSFSGITTNNRSCQKWRASCHSVGDL